MANLFEADEMNELIESIRALSARTKAGSLRALMPVIEDRLAAGVAQQDIVTALREGGIDLTLGTFKSYLHRHRAKLRQQSSSLLVAKPEPAHSNVGPLINAHAPIVEISEQLGSPESISVEPTLTDILDARKSDILADQYINRRPSLFRRNRS